MRSAPHVIRIGPLAAALVLAATFALSNLGRAAVQESTPHPLISQAKYDQWQVELSNWGRWGKDDELGTLNLITPAKRKQAVALVKEGFSVSLSRDASVTKELDNP